VLASAHLANLNEGFIVKKGVVVVLVLLAVVVLISPAIVGRLAEKSMDENLNWAASESGEVKITSEHYDRGWFSSEGQHRVEMQDGELLTAARAFAGPMEADDLPVLLINTRLDHGLIPVTSMSRDKGSLAPGLGSAISTMQVELPDGEAIDLPGTIYSKVALGGELESSYVLEAGSRTIDNATANWGDTSIDITTNPKNGVVEFDGTVGALSIEDEQGGIVLAGLTFAGKQRPTQYGFAVGSVEFALNDATIRSGGHDAGRIEGVGIKANSALDGDDLNANVVVRLVAEDLPNLGDMSHELEVTLTGADAGTLGRLQKGLESVGSSQDPMTMYTAVEDDAKLLFASGFELNFERLNVTLPQGTLTSQMRFSFGEEDPATFAWSSLLLSTEASIDVSIPEALMQMITQVNPQVAMAIGAGYLVKRGDAYVMKAELKKGLLIVNGAPIPIPLGAVR